MNEFVTWTTLGTYAGAVMMVTIITQFLKQTPLKNINTQLLAYIISVAILIGAEAFNGSALTVQGVVLCLLSLACGYFSMDREDVEWWFKIMIFMSTFLSGLMGLMLANFAFLAVRMGERLDDLSEE